MRILLNLFLLTVLLSVTSFAEAKTDYSNFSKQESEERIHISSDDLLIADNCLYLIQGEEIIPLPVLFSDSNGLYIKAEFSSRDACPNGHGIMHSLCNGCCEWTCIHRCRCFEEPFNKPSIKE
jgi:hypothetical protein